LIGSGYSPLGEAQYWYMHAAAMFETYLEILGVDMHVSFFKKKRKKKPKRGRKKQGAVISDLKKGWVCSMSHP